MDGFQGTQGGVTSATASPAMGSTTVGSQSGSSVSGASPSSAHSADFAISGNSGNSGNVAMPNTVHNASPSGVSAPSTPLVESQGQHNAEQRKFEVSYTQSIIPLPCHSVAQDGELVSRLKSFCAGAKLSPTQAEAAMSFWQQEQNSAMDASLKKRILKSVGKVIIINVLRVLRTLSRF